LLCQENTIVKWHLRTQQT